MDIPSTAHRARGEAMSRYEVKKGLVSVNAGYGKGKTTALLGVLLRAWGWDMRIGGIQFFSTKPPVLARSKRPSA